MPVLPEDQERYRQFVASQADVLGSVKFSPEQTLWHYTDGLGLLGIIESGTLYATQVACLNDSTEIRYASKLLRDALIRRTQQGGLDADVEGLLTEMTTALTEETLNSDHATSKYFVTCFSELADDLNQWRAYCGGENGYSIGFRAEGLFGDPNSLVIRVNYDKEQHRLVADNVVEATVRFFREGIEKKRAASPPEWSKEFIPIWSDLIGRLAPLVKDEAFRAESEFRIVHELQRNEVGRIRFRQRSTLLSRHLPTSYPLVLAPRFPMLPIVGVKVGPTRHREITRISVDTLMQQMGYGSGHVSNSEIPYQRT